MKQQLLLSLILLLAACGVADAQNCQVRVLVQACTPQTCRMEWRVGTAFNIGQEESGDYLILTAGHALRSGRVTQPNGVTENVTIRHVDVSVPRDGRMVWDKATPGHWYVDHERGIDVGVVRYSTREKLKSYPLADELPAEEVEVQYIGDRGQWETARIEHGGHYGAFGREVGHGESGGVVTFRGLAIGIISNTNRDGRTYFCHCRCIRQFLRHHGYKLRARGDVRKAPIAPLPPAAPVQDAPSSGHDARPPGVGCGCEAGCECRALRDKLTVLRGELAKAREHVCPVPKPDPRVAELEAELGKEIRRHIAIRTYQGKRIEADIVMQRNGGTVVYQLAPDGSIVETWERGPGEPIKFVVVEVPNEGK